MLLANFLNGFEKKCSRASNPSILTHTADLCFPAADVNTLSLNAAQTKYNLQVTSNHGNVSDSFSRALIEGGKFVFLDAYRCYASLPVGPLHLVRVFGEKLNHRAMDVVIYTR